MRLYMQTIHFIFIIFDNSESILVSQLLISENYLTWSKDMIMALSAKNKIGFIYGFITKHFLANLTYDLWNHCNILKSWSLNSLSQDLANSVIYVDTRSEIWSNVKERFSQLNAPCLFQIEKDIIYLG